MPRTLALLLTAALTAATAHAQDACQAAYHAFDQHYQQRYDLNDPTRLASLAHHARRCFERAGTRGERAAFLLEAETLALIQANDHHAALDRLAVFFDRYAETATASTRAARRLQQGHLAHLVGELPFMRRVLQEALAEARALADSSRHKVHLAVAGALHGTGQFHRAAEVLEGLLGELSEERRAERLVKAQALELLAHGALTRCAPPKGACSFELAATQARQAAALFDAAGRTRQAGQAQATRARLIAWLGRPHEAVELLEAVVAGALERGETALARETAGVKQNIEESFGLGSSTSLRMPAGLVYVLALGALAALVLLTHGAYRQVRRRRLLRGRVEVPYLHDPDETVSVPVRALHETADKPSYAMQEGRSTQVVKFCWRKDPLT